MTSLTRDARATSPNGRARTADAARAPARAAAPCSVHVDLTRVVVTAEVVLGAVAVADRLMRRPPATHADVVMGPGGWVSLKGGTMAVRPSARLWRREPPQPAGRRPLWARLLAAKALQTLVS